MPDHHAPIGVFLLDDHDVVRQGVAALLDAEPDIRVVSQSATVAGALPAIAATAPTVAVLDVRLQDGNGIEVCREIRAAHPAVRCLMLTSFSDDRGIVGAALAGADGFALKRVRDNGIVRSVRLLAAGHGMLDPAIVDASMQRLLIGAPQTIDALSPAETEVVERVVGGQTMADIAVSMGRDRSLMRNDIAAILGKLGVVQHPDVSGPSGRWQQA